MAQLAPIEDMALIKSALFIFISLFFFAHAEFRNDQGVLLQELRPEFRGEQFGASQFFPGVNVFYLNDQSRSKFEIFFRNGLAYDVEGNVFDTAGKPAIFVMDSSGRVFASKIQIVGQFHHSSLAGGKPVASAGEIIVSNGQVLAVNNKSGHYRPSVRTLRQFLDLLNFHGIDPQFESIGQDMYVKELERMLNEFTKLRQTKNNFNPFNFNTHLNKFNFDKELMKNQNKIKFLFNRCVEFFSF